MKQTVSFKCGLGAYDYSYEGGGREGGGRKEVAGKEVAGRRWQEGGGRTFLPEEVGWQSESRLPSPQFCVSITGDRCGMEKQNCGRGGNRCFDGGS